MSGAYRRGSRWYVRWRDGAGVLHRQVTTAKTERDARALVAELEAQASRVRLGLEAAPVRIKATLEQLCRWWLTERCPEPSQKMETLRLQKHVFKHELGRTPLQLVTPDAIEARLIELERGNPKASPPVRKLSAGSINRLRNTLHSVFSAAAEPPRRWQGENPVGLTRAREVTKHEHVILSPEQMPLVLAKAPDSWRGVLAVAGYLGLRRGEIFALRKTDYDRQLGTLTVAASHQRTTTKGKRIDVLPVPAILKPYLEAALKSTSVWLFPGPKGKQRTREADPHLVLRSACIAAGIVSHWELSCRRCKAEGRPSLVQRVTGARPEGKACPSCGMLLWVHAEPPVSRTGKVITFHDLRHAAATNLIKAGVPLSHVQRIIRHADIRTTIGVYGHLDNEDLRASLEAVTPGASGTASDGFRSSRAQTEHKPRRTSEEP